MLILRYLQEEHQDSQVFLVNCHTLFLYNCLLALPAPPLTKTDVHVRGRLRDGLKASCPPLKEWCILFKLG